MDKSNFNEKSVSSDDDGSEEEVGVDNAAHSSAEDDAVALELSGSRDSYEVVEISNDGSRKITRQSAPFLPKGMFKSSD